MRKSITGRSSLIFIWWIFKRCRQNFTYTFFIKSNKVYSSLGKTSKSRENSNQKNNFQLSDQWKNTWYLSLNNIMKNSWTEYIVALSKLQETNWFNKVITNSMKWILYIQKIIDAIINLYKLINIFK